MKKHIILLAFLLCICHLSWSQQFVKTTTPCNDELLKKTPGRWIQTREAFHAKVSQQQQKEIRNRLEAIHQLMFNVYPSPIAFDAVPSFFTTDQEFASQLKFDPSPDVRYRDYKANGIPTVLYSYSGFFCAYHCGRETYEMMRGYPSETGTSMGVEVNSLGAFFTILTTNDEIMRIDERPLKGMPVLVGKWKGYDLYSPETGSGVRMVLLHRDGILPYIPVTRKEYLDRCFKSLPKFFAEVFPTAPDSAVIKMIGQKEWDEQVRKSQKLKDDIWKHYRDELEATTTAGLLDSPAVVLTIMEIGTDIPIFTTQKSGGRMLVTENPVYMRKDLPKYIPQFMVYTLWDCHCGVDQSLNPYKLIEEKFPIEKLQAMIDK